MTMIPFAKWHIDLQPIPLSERFSIEIEPEILPDTGCCEVIIHNEGIRRTSYAIMAHDFIISLNFSEGQGRQKMVAPGQTERVSLHVSAKKRPLFGRPHPYPFTVQVYTPAYSQRSVAGQIIVKPLLPTWAAALSTLLLLVFLAGSIWLLST